MKANAKFVTEEEAVSPVIAVILMVAITVVLAATVFVLVSDIGGQTGGAAPSISWSNQEASDRLSVTSAAQNADWQRLAICVSNGVADIMMGADAATPTTAVNQETDDTTDQAVPADCSSPARISASAAKIAAGDFVELCDNGAAPPALQVQVRVTDTTANSVVHTYTFTDLAACSA